MPINVLCPTCHKELAAPDELAGKVAECPYCQHRFQVSAPKPVSSQTVRMSVPPPHPSTGKPVAANGPSSTKMPSVKNIPPVKNMPPAASSMEPAAPSIARGGPIPLVMPPVTAPPGSPTAAPSNSGPPVAPPVSGAGKHPSLISSPLANSAAGNPVAMRNPTMMHNPGVTPQTPPSSTKRRMNRAVFKTADTAKSQVHLGADGQLPELHLEEGPIKERPTEERKQTNPLVLMAVLGISVSLSVLLLLYDGETTQGEHHSKATARQVISEKYLSTAPLEPYQVLLREAQQAHAQGNIQLEQRRYRRVLDMLHAEDKNKNVGLTGLAEPSLNSQDAPNDRELEQLLSKLLADE